MPAEETKATVEVKPAETKAATEAKAAAETKPVSEKQTNCLGCNKPLKKLRRYYRDGKFYCTKKCWIKAVKSKEAKPA
jgi:hypothetical protein